MHADTANDSNQRISDLRWQQPAPSTTDALIAPPRHDAIAVGKHLQQRRDISWIVLIIAVDAHEHLAPGTRYAGEQCPVLSNVRLKIDVMKLSVAILEPFHQRETVICAGIVDEDNFKRSPARLYRGADAFAEGFDISLLVVD